LDGTLPPVIAMSICQPRDQQHAMLTGAAIRAGEA
jgi:hypothetical protein